MTEHGVPEPGAREVELPQRHVTVTISQSGKREVVPSALKETTCKERRRSQYIIRTPGRTAGMAGDTLWLVLPGARGPLSTTQDQLRF